MAQKRKTKRRPGRGFLRAWAWKGVFLLLIAGVGAAAFYLMWAWFFPLEQLGRMPQRSIVYDMDGAVMSRLHGENRIQVPLEKVSEHFLHALLAREDTRFYRHPGIDPIGIARALVRNVTTRSIKEGASTITQQLARNSYTLGGRTIHRKLLEAALAVRIEFHLSKEEILEHYVNRIYFGSGFYGVEAASQAYFGKAASSLSLSEGAMLAGLIRSPSRFSPFNNLAGAISERDAVLDRMVDARMLERSAAEGIKRWPVGIQPRARRSTQESYAMDAIIRDLDIILAEKEIEDGGLHIYTTIDPALNSLAEQALEEHLARVESAGGFPHPPRSAFTRSERDAGTAPRYVQGAVIVMDNRTGGIRALVGGRDYLESKYNRAIHARRQVGSTFKPFVYAAAFERGLLPATLVSDERISPGEIRSVSTNWSPSNADNLYGGLLPAATGIIRSRNTMSVRVGEMAGLDAVRQIAGRAGLGESIPRTPAIHLGAFESTLKDVVAAYSVFPNAGERRQSYLIERIDDRTGMSIYKAAHLRLQTVPPGVAFVTLQALEEVVSNGTASRARSLGVTFPAAGKTGTTNGYTDGWFVGFTTSLTCGVWVGMDRPGTIMSRGFGSTLALPVWARVVSGAPRARYPAGAFESPEPQQRVTVCSVSGGLATGACGSFQTTVDVDLPVSLVPRSPCSVHAGIAPVAAGSPVENGSERRPNFFERLFRRR